MTLIRRICKTLVIIGAINWLLIGLFNFNLVSFVFDNLSVVISRIIYSLVGIAGVYLIVSELFDLREAL